MSNIRQATWSNIGEDIREVKDIQEALKVSGLDYEVEKVPVFLANGMQVPDQFATKKVGSDEIFGVVGKNFEVVQNLDAFEFVDGIVDEGLSLVKAGETKSGSYIIGSLPSEYILGDEMKPFIIFQNSHNGGTTVRASISPLRIVCSNQFSIAWREAAEKVSIRHTRSVHDRMVMAQSVLSMAAENMNTLKINAEKMAKVHVSDAQVKAIIDAVFTIKEDDSTRKINTMEEDRADFIRALNEEDLANFKNTEWGLVNAYSDFITHRQSKRKTTDGDTSRFLYVTLNTDLMGNFMKTMQMVTR